MSVDFWEKYTEGQEWREREPVIRTDTDAGLRVVACWRTDYYGGPHFLGVEVLPDAAPQVLERGVTTGSLARAQQMLGGILAEWEARLEAAGEADRWTELQNELESIVGTMPADPRSGGDDYYRGLLRAYDLVKSSGHPAPLQVLETALGIKSRNTLNTRLRTARLRLSDQRGG